MSDLEKCVFDIRTLFEAGEQLSNAIVSATNHLSGSDFMLVLNAAKRTIDTMEVELKFYSAQERAFDQIQVNSKAADIFFDLLSRYIKLMVFT